MPDSYFVERSKENPEILYHDAFLLMLVDEEKQKKMVHFENDYTPQEENTDVSPLNLTKFVKLIDFNRRFSYQGSLTTAPCAEGILWNVVETVIPIRQSTLDEFTEFRRVAEEISTDYIIPETMKETMDQFAQAKARHPDNC